VEDDGPGFAAGFDPARDGDIGFALMADKARELGGRLSAGSGPAGRGARVRISFPARA
jgi:nitrate/nitrite-specific signal transduction histidine kinase